MGHGLWVAGIEIALELLDFGVVPSDLLGGLPDAAFVCGPQVRESPPPVGFRLRMLRAASFMFLVRGPKLAIVSRPLAEQPSQGSWR